MLDKSSRDSISQIGDSTSDGNNSKSRYTLGYDKILEKDLIKAGQNYKASFILKDIGIAILKTPEVLDAYRLRKKQVMQQLTKEQQEKVKQLDQEIGNGWDLIVGGYSQLLLSEVGYKYFYEKNKNNIDMHYINSLSKFEKIKILLRIDSQDREDFYKYFYEKNRQQIDAIVIPTEGKQEEDLPQRVREYVLSHKNSNQNAKNFYDTNKGAIDNISEWKKWNDFKTKAKQFYNTNVSHIETELFIKLNLDQLKEQLEHHFDSQSKQIEEKIIGNADRRYMVNEYIRNVMKYKLVEQDLQYLYKTMEQINLFCAGRSESKALKSDIDKVQYYLNNALDVPLQDLEAAEYYKRNRNLIDKSCSNKFTEKFTEADKANYYLKNIVKLDNCKIKEIAALNKELVSKEQKLRKSSTKTAIDFLVHVKLNKKFNRDYIKHDLYEYLIAKTIKPQKDGNSSFLSKSSYKPNLSNNNIKLTAYSTGSLSQENEYVGAYDKAVKDKLINQQGIKKNFQDILQGNGNNNNLKQLTELIFCTEVQRNPAALLTNAMFFDLVDKGVYKTEEIVTKMPMAMKGAMPGTTTIDKEFEKKFPVSSPYDYRKMPKEKEAKELAEKDTQILQDWMVYGDKEILEQMKLQINQIKSAKDISEINSIVSIKVGQQEYTSQEEIQNHLKDATSITIKYIINEQQDQFQLHKVKQKAYVVEYDVQKIRNAQQQQMKHQQQTLNQTQQQIQQLQDVKPEEIAPFIKINEAPVDLGKIRGLVNDWYGLDMDYLKGTLVMKAAGEKKDDKQPDKNQGQENAIKNEQQLDLDDELQQLLIQINENEQKEYNEKLKALSENPNKELLQEVMKLQKSVLMVIDSKVAEHCDQEYKGLANLDINDAVKRIREIHAQHLNNKELAIKEQSCQNLGQKPFIIIKDYRQKRKLYHEKLTNLSQEQNPDIEKVKEVVELQKQHIAELGEKFCKKYLERNQLILKPKENEIQIDVDSIVKDLKLIDQEIMEDRKLQKIQMNKETIDNLIKKQNFGQEVGQLIVQFNSENKNQNQSKNPKFKK